MIFKFKIIFFIIIIVFQKKGGKKKESMEDGIGRFAKSVGVFSLTPLPLLPFFLLFFVSFFFGMGGNRRGKFFLSLFSFCPCV